MARVKGAMMTRKRRNKTLKLAKGYWGNKSRHFKMANEQVMKSLTYAYVGRRLKKRDFRSLWITRISAACKLNGMNYKPRVARPLFFLRLLPRRHRGDQTVDGRAQLMELRLVVGHHADGAVRVQIVRDLGERKAKLRDLLHRPGEKRGVVRLEMGLPAVLEHLAVELEEIAVRQAALGVALRRPRVAEVYVYARGLARGEKLGQDVRVRVDEADVPKPLGGAAPMATTIASGTISTATNSTSGPQRRCPR